MYQVSQIPAFNDNYIWLLRGDSNLAAVVDPGDADVVIDVLEKQQLTLTEILVTHHHPDHIGGVEKLKTRYPNVQVYAPNTQRFSQLGLGVKDGDKVQVKAIGAPLQVIELHGHTRDHIGYIDDTNAFVGDTLFSGGCGRLFEGSAEQLHASLSKLAQRKPTTLVYCAHEYTLANLAFAESVDRQNTDLLHYKAQCQMRREQGLATIPTTIETELKINPFLRSGESQIQLEIQNQCGLTQRPSELECFALLRQLKDNF